MSFKATNDTWDVLYEVAGQVVRLKMKDLVFLKFDFQNSGVLGGFPPPVAAKNAFFPNQGVSQTRPSFHAKGIFEENKLFEKPKAKTHTPITQLWHANGRCPKDTIPMPRPRKRMF
ncbi:hypothetical protein GLYMA_05G091751v4 [Glycine max]|nr:hypothetical protein GLYMA_05G091751v4 [Glycine max]KAH1133554.1 hypothetical protein GYH30_012096 [Glycine max]